jgi:putative hydrolase of the HAD superfamily
MKLYTNLFFDLDETLWDFQINSREALQEIALTYNFSAKGIPSIEIFLEAYFPINEKMWEHFRNGVVDMNGLRYKRFEDTFKLFNINDTAFINQIANAYTTIAPQKTNLLPYAKEALDYLFEKYTLHIITNGFEEVQHIKINNCNLSKYFKTITSSEKSGFKKPDARMFQYAFSQANAQAQNSIMIGDSLEADILGAKNVGMDQVYFNPLEKTHSEHITHEINSLNALLKCL